MNSPASKTSSAQAAAGVKSPASNGKQKPAEGTRETIEAVAIAFVLAFLFKTFQAEMYVIPTGSMAPTLLGRHKEVLCDSCQFKYTVGASQEIDQSSGVVMVRLATSECPNCNHQNAIKDAPVFNGDRIIVNKQVDEFRRFDVVVFKNPEEPHVNYIKRLVGLPGETIRLRQGDLFARMSDQEPWRILRKDDRLKQKDIQLTVYDDRYPSRQLLDAGAPERWVPATMRDRSQIDPSSEDPTASLAVWLQSESSWQCDREARTYSIKATAETEWLRYQHLVASENDWKEIEKTGQLKLGLEPSLIVDFCGFNSFAAEDHSIGRRSYDDGLFWVGDLTLNATVEIHDVQNGGMLTLELIEGLRWYRCEIDVQTGNAQLFLINRLIDQDAAVPELKATASTGLSGNGIYDVSYANVDDRICLWVDGTLVEFGEGAEFNLSQPAEATYDDLTHVGIAASNLSATISDLVIQRDIYYRNDTIAFVPANGTTPPPGSWNEGRNLVGEVDPNETFSLATVLKNPPTYARRYSDLVSKQLESFGQLSDYSLSEGEYLMFGDNSPASKDSRLFDYYNRPVQGRGGHRYAVQQQDLIGKALFIFWPHAVPFMNDGNGYTLTNHKVRGERGPEKSNYPMYRFPFYPNLSRMKKIR